MENTREYTKAKEYTKKRGPVAGFRQPPATARTTVMLETDLVEWGKRQPGGLSALLRRLLTQEQSMTQEQSTKQLEQAAAR